MKSGILTIASFISALFFPWPYTAVIAVGAAVFEPLVPLAVGLFVDILYYSPVTSTLPLFTLGGAVVSIVAYIVRTRVRAGRMD
jgi:hypothetical protein